MTPIIRASVKGADITYCAQLMARSSPWNLLYFSEDQCFQSLAAEGVTLHIAEFDGSLVGFVATRGAGIEGEPLLEYICVDEGYRSRGVGGKLLQFVEDVLFPDADNLYLFVSDINPRAMALYERLQYARVGELPDYNLFGQTEYLYRKSRRPRQERFRPELG